MAIICSDLNVEIQREKHLEDVRNGLFNYHEGECSHNGCPNRWVRLEHAYTMYSWDGLGTPPNGAHGPWCAECAAEIAQLWKEQWDDYYASVI